MRKLWIISAFFFFALCAFTYLFIDTNFIYLQSLYTGMYLNNRLLLTTVYFLLVSALFICYFLILKGKDKKMNNRFLLIPLLGILAYPAALSFDLFNYIATAKVAFYYLENPYIVMPIEMAGEPTLVFTRAINKIALYGPLWTIISGIPFLLSFGNYLFSILLFKTFVGIFYFGISWLIYKISKSYTSVLYFAANPLVIIETFVSGHNDVVMMFLALFSIYSLRNKKYMLAVLFLISSIMIKYAAIFLIPLFVYYLYKHIKKKEIDWYRLYAIGFVLMLAIFFLSPFREEIYPWYAIWPLTFLTLTKNNWLKSLFAVFSFGLMLRYMPFILTGNYFGVTPNIKLFLTYAPVLIFILFSKLFKSFKLY